MSEMKEYRTYGPPGTGKTTWIARNAVACAEKYGEDQVSICSLTNTAIKEVIGRDIPLDEDNIATLHARCKRALSAPPPAESMIKEFAEENPKWANTDGSPACLPRNMFRGMRTDGGEILAESIFSSGGKDISLYERAQILRQQMRAFKDWPPHVKQFHDVWINWCKDRGVMDFTGWLEEALRVKPLPQQQVVFVDEAQDHTPLQLAVIRHSWKAMSKVLVGDDDQNLYEWSGAIPKEFFGVQIPQDQEKVLSQSWRVPRRVHEIAVRWISKMIDRKDKGYMPRDADGEVKILNYTYNDTVLPPHLLEDSSKTYMILTSCGYMLDSIIQNLKENGIPFHNPYRKVNLKWNPLTNPWRKVESFLVGKRLWTGVEASEWANILRAKGVFNTGMKEEFIARCESAGTNKIEISDIRDCFLPEMQQRVLEQDTTVLRDMRKMGMTGHWDYVFKVLGRPKEEQRPRVIVGTIHSVKGGEADVVYLFPDLSPSGFLDFTGYNKDRVRRLFYVGMTRAKEKLYLAGSASHRSVFW